MKDRARRFIAASSPHHAPSALLRKESRKRISDGETNEQAYKSTGDAEADRFSQDLQIIAIQEKLGVMRETEADGRGVATRRNTGAQQTCKRNNQEDAPAISRLSRD